MFFNGLANSRNDAGISTQLFMCQMFFPLILCQICQGFWLRNNKSDNVVMIRVSVDADVVDNRTGFQFSLDLIQKQVGQEKKRKEGKGRETELLLVISPRL